MPYKKYSIADDAYGRLGSSVSTTLTTIPLSSSQNLTAGNWIGTLVQYGLDGYPTKKEKVYVTTNNSGILSVTRGYDGSPAQTFSTGDYIFMNVVVEVFKDMQEEITRLNTAKPDASNVYTKTEVDGKFTSLLNGAGPALDTLKEIQDALGNDANFASTITNALAGKANDSAVVHIAGNEIMTGNKTIEVNSPSATPSFKVKADNPGIQLLSWGSTAGNYGVITNGSNALYSSQGRISIVSEGSGNEIVFSTGGAGNNRMMINGSGNIGMGISPTEKLHISGRLIMANMFQSNKKYFVIEDGGAGQVGSSFSMYGYSNIDSTSFRVAQYVDRDGSIVGVDKYMMYMYPQDSSGNPVDYMNVFGISANRGNGTTAVEFPRVTDNFSVGGQNWMNSWSSYTPTAGGDGGSGATLNVLHAKYKRIGKTCHFALRAIITSKGTCTGNVYISAPQTAVGIQAVSGGIFPIGTKDTRGFPGVYISNFTFTSSSQSANLSWSGAAVNDEIFLAGSYEIA